MIDEEKIGYWKDFLSDNEKQDVEHAMSHTTDTSADVPPATLHLIAKMAKYLDVYWEYINKADDDSLS